MRRTYKNEVINHRLNADEIRQIVRDDFSGSFQRRFDSAFRAYLKGCNDKDVRGEFSMICKSGQKYNFYVSPGRKNDGSMSMYYVIIVYCVAHEYQNICYYSFSAVSNNASLLKNPDEPFEVNRYTDHVMSRYSERQGYGVYGKNAFVRFFIENPILDPMFINDTDIIARTSRGALVGKIKNGIYHYNTFYNDDMARNCRLRDAYLKSNVVDDERNEKTRSAIESLIRHFDKGAISQTTFLSEMSELENEITEDFLGYAETTREELNSRINELVKRNAVRASSPTGSSHIEARKSRLGVSTCIPGVSYRMQTNNGLFKTRFQDC